MKLTLQSLRAYIRRCIQEGDVATGLYASLGRNFITGPEKDPNNTPETPHDTSYVEESDDKMDEASGPRAQGTYEYLLDVAANIKSYDPTRMEQIERELRSMRVKPIRVHQILSLTEELNEMQVELDHMSGAGDEDSDEFVHIEEEHSRLEDELKHLLHSVLGWR